MNVPADTPVTPRRRPRNLAQGLVESITERIRGGDIRPGDKLPTESEIMRQFGVSRTVVREALSRLQASGGLCIVCISGCPYRRGYPRPWVPESSWR